MATVSVVTATAGELATAGIETTTGCATGGTTAGVGTTTGGAAGVVAGVVEGASLEDDEPDDELALRRGPLRDLDRERLLQLPLLSDINLSIRRC